MRAQRLNHHFARRLGWGRHAQQIAGRLGSPTALPWSLPFVRAVARWQRGVGAPVTGVITPDVWARLRASVVTDQSMTPPPEQLPPMPVPGIDDMPMAAAPPSAGMEPLDQPDHASASPAGADDAVDGGTAAGMGAVDGGTANEWGWSTRW